jgi:hypothetical protein
MRLSHEAVKLTDWLSQLRMDVLPRTQKRRENGKRVEERASCVWQPASGAGAAALIKSRAATEGESSPDAPL